MQVERLKLANGHFELLAKPGLGVDLNQEAVTVEGATISRINWVWGDGSSSDSSFPAEHIYGVPGSYEVRVTAFDSLGRSKAVDIQVKQVLIIDRMSGLYYFTATGKLYFVRVQSQD